MKKQIEQLLIKENISPSKFADELGIQRSSISHIMSGRNNPGYDFIIKILEHYKQINAEWLLTGNGTMYKIDKKTESIPVLTPKFESKEENSPIYGITNVNTSPKEVKTDQKDDELHLETLVKDSKNIKQVMFFYSDGTFDSFNPSK